MEHIFDIRKALVTKIFVWSCFVAILYLLRTFALLIFLTFIFAYIQTLGVKALQPLVRHRMPRVILTGLFFLGTFIIFGMLVVPRVKDEIRLLATNYPQYVEKTDIELMRLSSEYPLLKGLIPGSGVGFERHGVRTSPSAEIFDQITGKRGDDKRSMLDAVQKIASSLLAMTSAFMLAVLFSFLIVLDLPHLIEKARSLKDTRIGFIYDEVAPSILEFGRVMGKSPSAQATISVFNTVFTAGIIYYLGLGEKVAFLSLIVLVCGLIPVAGVFISSLPICLMVLQDGGPGMVLAAILGIWVVHLIETYILNPKIWGHHLHINPVLVLIILTVSGKLFGVWGLILGLPLSKYIFGYAI